MLKDDAQRGTKMKHNRCIFHIPNHLDEKGSSGSQVRPRKMLKAFQNIGYEVDVVMGYGAERKKQIEAIKNNIVNGVCYDFLYSESSTMPTQLTEKDHIPRYPFLDFNFFKFCHKNGIPIGLFYRDIYWRFPIYKEGTPLLQYLVAETAYRFDLREYAKFLDIFYVPNKKISRYVRNKRLDAIMDELPPGSVFDSDFIAYKRSYYEKRLKNYNNKISLFYVGGVGNQYIFDSLLEGAYDIENLYITICCREKEWVENEPKLKKYLTDRIRVVHRTGTELEEYYREADIALAFFLPDIYREMAVPIKLFEYMGHGIPVLASNDTAVGSFVSENNIGWSIDYNANTVHNLLQELIENYQEVVDKHNNCLAILNNNTWEGRAYKVSTQLSSCKASN